MKNITIFYRQMNYKNIGKGIATLQKSLNHSLRVTPNNPTKNLEWDDSKSAHNQIYLPEKRKVITLDSLSQEERVNIISNIIDEVKVNKKSNSIDTENKNDLGKYKAKLNKILKSSTDNPELYNYLNNIINSKTELDSEKEKSIFGQFELQRKNQKIECLGKFIELHNKVLNPKNTKDIGLNEAVIQEAVFKIPARNEVEVSLNDIVKIQSSFYTKNFPEYTIKAIAIHADESDEHSHIFVSTKNKKTNQHDLLKAQYRFVEQNIDEERLSILNNEPSSYKRKKLQAEYFQVLFYSHANQALNKLGLNAQVLEKTEENKARMREIEEDAKRPKIERQFNFNNLRIKKQMNNIKNLDKQENQIKNSIVELEKKETNKKKTLDNMDQEEITKQNKLDEMDREEVVKRNKIDEMDTKLDKLTTAVEFMTDKYHRMKDSLESLGTLITDFVIEKMCRVKNSKTQIEIRANINKLAEEFGTDEPANEMIDEFAKQSDHRVKQDVLGLKRPKM
ncbi:hypothetical protein [Pseudomonas proteolytica]|uniref:hypothetical protein n=1 Tax=Pseudomonas proteolytica TaxID=219574 RepID=UPI001473FE43|nr:hypothetical protein [Pseudomonas proteolytica]NMZ39755.1 hypothetical protein [Pseudomonas proteolytica]